MAAAGKRLRTPLLLQDICMLHVLLRVEDFPVQSLALLSHTIRRKIFSGLSYVDILHLDSPDQPMLFTDVKDRFYIIDTRKNLLETLFVSSSSCVYLFLNIWCALREHHDFRVLHAHVCECYPSLEPTSINGFLLPKRYLPFVDLQSSLGATGSYPSFRPSLIWPLLYYCNMQRAPTEFKINVYGFKSSVFWMEFSKYMTDIKNDAQANSISNPKIHLVIPFIQEFFSTVEVLEIGTYTALNMYIISYVLLYNIITSSRPRLKHIKVFGIPDFIRHVMSTVVELLHATCTTPSKSIFHQYTGLEPLSLPTIPYILEGITVYPYESMTASCASSISRDLIRVLELQMPNLKSVTINHFSFCRNLDSDSKYGAFLALLVQFIKQPQFTELTVVKSPLPEGFELILAFLLTPASDKQSLTIEASNQRSVEEAKDTDSEEDEEEENWIVDEDQLVNEDTSEDEKKGTCDNPPNKKFKSDHSPTKPPCFPSEPLPLSNAQYKCLDLGQSSDCVYSWLFDQLPELKLKSLKMRTLDVTIVPANLVVQVEHVAFTLARFNNSGEPAISPAHLEKFVFSNPALKQLEFIEPTDANTASYLPMLNHCLQELDCQGRGLEELMLTAVQLDRFIDTQLKEFLIHLRDFSYRYGTTLVLSPYYFHKIAGDFFVDLSKEFQEIKIKKIICIMSIDDDDIIVDPTPQLELLAEVVNVRHCRPSV